MSLYCLYNATTNALLGVDTEPMQVQEGQAVAIFPRDTLPDFAIEAWNPSILAFYTKPTAQLTQKAFLKRFSAQEYAAVKAAAAANGTVDYYFQLMMSAEYICVSDPDTMAGVQMLEQAGLLVQGRAAEILA